MKRALIKDLHAVAKQRGEGYLEACLKAGKISPDGQWMIFDDAAHTKIRLQYNAQSKVGRGERRESLALGDLVHKIAGPIGKAIHWPCLKGDGTTDLKPGSPCDRAKKVLNKVQV
jgi:hypothetical protein